MRGRGKMPTKDLRRNQSWKRPTARWNHSCPTCGAPPRQGGVLYADAGIIAFLARDQDGVVCGVKCSNCQLAPAVVLPLDQ
jgi:hypothetical protein